MRSQERFRLLTCLRAPAASLLAPAALLDPALLAPATPATTAETPAASEAPERSSRRQPGASVCGLGVAAAALPAAPRLAALAALEAALAPHEVASPPPLAFLSGVQLLRAVAASCRHATARGVCGGEGALVADKRGGAEAKAEAEAEEEEVEAGAAGGTEAVMTLAVVEAVEGAGVSEAAADDAVRQVAARAAKALLRAQALHLIATSADGTTPRATALAAADWLLALCASAAVDEEAAAASAAAAAAAVSNGAAGGAAGSAAGGAAGGVVRRLGQARRGDLAKVCARVRVWVGDRVWAKDGDYG